MAKVVTICVVLIAIGSAASAFEFIPQAVLSAVIFAAISQLICISDFWEAWKHSKKDFFTMMVTAAFTFVFETSIGLAIGIGCSVIVFFIDQVLNSSFNPELCVKASDSERNIDIVKLHCDVNFLTAARVKDFISPLSLTQPAKADASSANRSDYLHSRISESFDYALIHGESNFVDHLPSAIVIDLTHVHVCDLTGMQCLAEIMHETRIKKVKCVIINESDKMREELSAFHIVNDSSSLEVDLEDYLAQSKMPQKDGHGHGHGHGQTLKEAEKENDKEMEKDLEAQVVDASAIELTPVEGEDTNK